MMYADSLIPALEALARRAAEAEGLELAWIELKRQGGSFVFRVFIERTDGNTGLSDCERVSSRLGLLLDVEDPIESSYTLEVSTPGLDRPLHGEKDYERFTGRLARVKTKEAFRGRRRLVGRIDGLSAGTLLLSDDELGVVSVPLDIIDVCRLEVELEEPGGASGARRSERRRRRERGRERRGHDGSESQESQRSQGKRKRA